MNISSLQQRNRELSILNSIAQDLNRGLALEDALNATLRQVVHLFDLKTGWIWLFEHQEEKAQLKATYNLPPAFWEQPQLLEGTCYCIEKYLRGNLENAANISEITCSRLKELTSGTEGLQYHASIPLYGPQQKIGLMNVLSTNSQQLSESDLQLLYTIGDMLSIAIERARLFERSKQTGRLEERNRLAREIHDTLAQGLSAISLKLQTMELLFDHQQIPKKINKLLEQTQALTQANLEDARRSVLDLRASPLIEQGLDQALQQLLATGQVPYEFHCLGTVQSLPLRQEMGLYRIAQEAIQNAFKHASAQLLQVRLHFQAHQVDMWIEDDGKGFDPQQTNTTGFGLIGISERVKLLNGQFQLTSQPEQGTIIHVKIPLL